MRRDIFVSGGTGYLGRVMMPRLLERGHAVRSIVRKGSEGKLPQGVGPVEADALDAATFSRQVAPSDTFVHLVGVAKPAPWKGLQFRAVDEVSLKASVAAATASSVPHFIYVSVAHPAPIMQPYIAVRRACEATIKEAGLNATILRPWYVLGPGHRWPAALKPAYWILENIPATRQGALRLGFVTLEQMVEALVRAVENPAQGIRIIEVPAIRNVRSTV